MYSRMTAKQVAELLEVKPETGLDEVQAAQRSLAYGKNIIDRQKEKSIFSKLAYQFSDPMVIILILAAIISFVTECLNGSADFVDPAIIMGIVCLNAGIGVFQESKAEKALEALKDMLSPMAQVRRKSVVIKIPVEDIVPGDIIIIETGDVIPADCRLIKSVGLMMDEAAMTGESNAVSKNAEIICDEDTALGDRKNMVWSATTVSTGRAEAVVTAIGMSTEVGKIAGIIMEETLPQTPLQQKLAKTGQSLGIGALIICGIIFVFGLCRAMPPMDIFLTAVSLAVAAIPEGLPAIVTIMLAIGVQRMAYNRGIIRKLSAVETLGSASVICSDKTGTITQNRMKVRKWWSNAAEEQDLYLCAVLCSNNVGQTEKALGIGAAEKGFYKKEWDMRYPRLEEIPFDSEAKWMGTRHRFPWGEQEIAKGATEVILNKCSLSDEERSRILRKNNEFTEQALRVIGFAKGKKGNYEDMQFVGLAGIDDPPRPEAKEAIRTCREAGIKVVMITGDHEKTATAIARETGLLESDRRTISGKELHSMTDVQLVREIENYAVFARVSPKDKARIVRAYQKCGHVVAMTGDGVNDAPALKIADIGCAMGISGTAVAREASDMVLADDNFATIVKAVKEGRGIYDNIKKAIHFLLSSNIGEILTIFIAIISGVPTPLLPVQLLWINLITDSFPAIALGVDPADEDIMKRKPAGREKSLFADGMSWNILIEGVMIGVLALTAFALGQKIFMSLDTARTMSFCVLAMSQLVHAFNMRSETRSAFESGMFSNLYLVGAFLIGVFLQILIVSEPVLAGIFKVSPLSGFQWIIVAGLSLFPLLFVETEKFLYARADSFVQTLKR